MQARITNGYRATDWQSLNGFRLLLFVLLLTLSGSLAASPVYLNTDTAITELDLAPVNPPSDIFQRSQLSQMTEQNLSVWYRLDIELSPAHPQDWLLVFRQPPHKKLDVFVPVNGGYQLEKMGIDGSRSGIAPNAIPLELKPGERKTYYLRHEPAPLNPLNPELWPALTYFETLGEQRTTLGSIQTLLIVAVIFIITLTRRNRTPAPYLLIGHMVAAIAMIQMWQGDIFRTVLLPGDPGHWLLLITTLVLMTAIACYRTLALLSIHTPKTERLILSLCTLATAPTVYIISTGSPAPEATMELVVLVLLVSLALVVLATAYGLYNGLRPAKMALPLALTLFVLLSLSGYTQAWPRSLPTYPEVLLLSLHGALLPLLYWYGHQQNLRHAMSINAIAPGSSKRRIFEAALREHLQTPDSPLNNNDLAHRVLATFEQVLPGIPAMIVRHQHNEWHIIPGETTDYTRTTDNLSRQLPTIEEDLLNVISSGTETKINFKDRFGTIYWVLPLSIEAEDKILMVLAPARPQRNATTWQTACDISNHACTRFQANRQSRFWQQQASLDPLTGLLNRRAFAREAERIIQLATSHDPIQACCALFIDIDHFKQLNDQLGHGAGDQILEATARICRQTLRHKDLLARYGGEEFVALLPSTEPWQAFRVAERIRNAIASDHANNSQWASHQPITVSIGISALSADANSLEEILEQADSAMYQAKRRGKNRTAISPGLTDIRIPLSQKGV